METNHVNGHITPIGTICGTIFTLIGTIDPHDIVKTIVLAAIGAVVSFVVSVVLKKYLRF